MTKLVYFCTLRYNIEQILLHMSMTTDLVIRCRVDCPICLSYITICFLNTLIRIKNNDPEKHSKKRL